MRAQFMLLFIFFAMLSCANDENFPIKKQYSILETNEVIDINETGVTLSANWIPNQFDDIVSYGFAWINNTGRSDNFVVIPYDPSQSNSLEIRILSEVWKGHTYYCRSFVETQNNLIVGNEITFIAQGSEPLVPEIIDFSPKSGPVGTIVTMIGKNFSHDSNITRVWFNRQRTAIKDFSNYDLIVFKIRDVGLSGPTIISVQNGTGKPLYDAYTTFDITN